MDHPSETYHDRQKTLGGPGQAEIFVKRSRFLGYSQPITTEQEWESFHQRILESTRDATHCAYAYLLHADYQRYYDAGEPKGSAGKAILSSLTAGSLLYAAVIVVRYYGGTKLGCGGLWRAYAEAAHEAVAAAGVGVRCLHFRWKLIVEYAQLPLVEHQLTVAHATGIHHDFTASVHITAWIPARAETRLREALQACLPASHIAREEEAAWKVIPDPDRPMG